MEETELTEMEVLRVLCPGMSDLELQALMCPELAWVWEILEFWNWMDHPRTAL